LPDRLLQRLKDAYAVRLLKEMIAIPSVVGQEGALAGYIRDELQRIGLRCEMHVVEAGRPNVYASLEAAAPGPHLVFCGHTDTVPPAAGWSTDPFTPVEKDGRIYGLGACDMKAGLACMLNAVRAFAESGIEFKGTLSFAAVIDEEGFSFWQFSMPCIGRCWEGRPCTATSAASPMPTCSWGRRESPAFTWGRREEACIRKTSTWSENGSALFPECMP